MRSPISGVLVVDDHAVFAEALSSALHDSTDFDDVRWSRSAREALELARTHAPQLALVDLRMPEEHGSELISKLAELDDPPTIVVLSAASDARSILGAFEAGASGYLGKHESFDAVIRACHEALDGEKPISASAFGRLLPRLLKGGIELTDQEERVLGLMARGMSNDEIGLELDISPNTARNHVSSILRKLGCDNRAAAVQLARSQGIIPEH